MFLQHDRARTIRKILDAAQLAGFQFLLPIFAADRRIENLPAVEPMLDAAVIDDDFAVVELVDRF